MATPPRLDALYDHPRSVAQQADRDELDARNVIAGRHAKEIRDLAAEHAADRKAILQGGGIAGPTEPAGKAIQAAKSMQLNHEVAAFTMQARHARELAAAKKAINHRGGDKPGGRDRQASERQPLARHGDGRDFFASHEKPKLIPHR